MKPDRCLVCGGPVNRRHHPTGRNLVNGHYMDPRFTFGVCHDHHELFHDDWRTLGIQETI
jgi:hypothetical protein